MLNFTKITLTNYVIHLVKWEIFTYGKPVPVGGGTKTDPNRGSSSKREMKIFHFPKLKKL